ncbi:MAG: prolyl oligopeptidase family serine peptidase [Planctomycetaceae bacterium]|jgi:predicted peptidase|nr:prolyl oligopeptidase family serine peptidase [Planctomycetaceae bacterium]
MKTFLKLFFSYLIMSGTTSLVCLFAEEPVSQESANSESVKPEPGKQVPQKITLPQSASVWEEKSQGVVKRLGEIKPLDESKTEVVQYLLYLPKDYAVDSEKEYPALLFLHGAGERGDKLDAVTVHGPPKLLAQKSEIAEKCPLIVISPQCKNGYYWSPAQLLLLLDEIEKNYKVDKSRVYVTGLSMGGFGSWMIASLAPERFAAVAPICGGFNTEQAKNFVEIPMWVFHGDADQVVPSEMSKKMVKAIEDVGGKKIRLTIYPGVGHDSWTQTYDNIELYHWFLSNKKNIEK